MSDLELLERSAQAAGINVYRGHGWQSDRLFRPTVGDGKIPGIEWNPLTDDGDALRLAAKLYLWEPIRLAHRDVTDGVDIYAATRRAIVRAAAAMADKP